MSLEDDLSCPVCTDVFCEPVLMTCGHSFCRRCITEHWTVSGSRSCPVCRQLSPQEPLSNLGLRNACESYLKELRSEKLRTEEEPKCHIHGEKLLVFCTTDQQAICSQCKKQAHRNHKTQTLQKTVQQYKRKLNAALSSAEKSLTSLQNRTTQDAKVCQYIQFQTLQTETSLKEEFKKLHQFLEKEEESRIAALDKEKKEKRGMIENIIQGRIESISDMIRDVKEDINDNDIDLLENYTGMINRIECTLMEPLLCSDSLIDVPKHLGNMKYEVWNNMKDVCSYCKYKAQPFHTTYLFCETRILLFVSPDPLVLNPNTAPPCFSVSDDLTSVSSCVLQRDNRNPLYQNCLVLGNVGYLNGAHTFTVEVGNSRHWAVGVYLEHLGFVYGLKRDGDLYHLMSSQIMFKIKGNVQVVRVNLDDYYDLCFRRWRKVSFFDARTNSRFAEISRVPLGRRLFPFVTPGERAGPLRIVPADATLTVEEDEQKLYFHQRYRNCLLFCLCFISFCFLYCYCLFGDVETTSVSDSAKESL